MNNMKFNTFKTIIKYLEQNQIQIQSELKHDEFFENVNSIEEANNKDLIFFNDIKYLDLLKNTKAKACFLNNDHVNLLPKNCYPIIVKDPYLAFAHITNLFYEKIKSNGIISKNVNIADDHDFGKNIQINNFVSIKKNVKIEDNVIIEENCVIGSNVLIKENTHIGPNSYISDSTIGKNCFLKSNLSIGGRGFGFDTNQKITFEHFGQVSIEDNVHIGSNTSIDRATFGKTIIGAGTRLDNLIQVAHNVKIGKNCVIAAQVGIAGSTMIGNNVIIGGQAGISGHLKIGNNIIIAAKSGVTKNLNDNSIVAGFPAIDLKKWKLNTIKFNK